MPENDRALPCIAQPRSTEPSLVWRTALVRLEGAYAPKTLHGYAADLEIFERWCERLEILPFPAVAGELARFVDGQMVGCAPRTVMRRLAAIRKIHRLLGLPDESRDEEVLLAVRRGLMLRGRPPRQALGLSAALRDQLLASCPTSVKGLRDRALIAVG